MLLCLLSAEFHRWMLSYRIKFFAFSTAFSKGLDKLPFIFIFGNSLFSQNLIEVSENTD